MDKQSYYFTFGTEGHPYRGGWVEVIASNRREAERAFIAKYPPKGSFIPCAGIYSQKEFEETKMHIHGNFDARCHETIEGE